MKKLWKREPVVSVGAIVSAIMLVVGLLVAFGVVDISPEQMTILEKALTAVLVLMFGLLPTAGSFLSRERVTPVDDPRNAYGEPAQLVSLEKVE